MQKERAMTQSLFAKGRSSSRSRGFTLTEVMIVVAIIAILVAVAYPAYDDHVRKGRRAAAQNFMMQVATKQQQYLADVRQYALGADFLSNNTKLNLPIPPDVASYYAFTVEPAAATTPPSFTIVGTPQGAQVKDGVLRLTHLGDKQRDGKAGW